MIPFSCQIMRFQFSSPCRILGVCASLVVYSNSPHSCTVRAYLLGSFWLVFQFALFGLALVYGTVLVQDFNTYVVYLGIGLVVWNGISAAIGSAPNLFEHNRSRFITI